MEILDFQQTRYDEIVQNQANATTQGIVFFGDSILEWYDVTTYLPELSDAYNCGLRSATTKTALSICQECVIAYQPKTVVLMIGTNDFSKIKNANPTDVTARLQELVAKIREALPESHVVVISAIPTQQNLQRAFHDTYTRNQLLRRYHECSQEQFRDQVNVEYIAVYDAFEQDGELDSAYTVDGLHLNHKGYQVLTDCIKEIILSTHHI